MADRNYSPYQQKVIKRYYDNRDDIDQQKLSELVTNLYLAEGKKKEKLWVQAKELMERLKIKENRVAHVIDSQDPTVLAEVVKDLQSGTLP